MPLSALDDVNRPLSGAPDTAIDPDDFGYGYFDDPSDASGFGGYHRQGNPAEGARDWAAEAAAIAAIPGVRTVLDVGCAKGFLVEALRGVGLEAWGVDVSDYAISTAPPDVRPWLSVRPAHAVAELGGFDVVHVCGVMIYLDLAGVRRALRAVHAAARIGAVLWEPSLEHLARLWAEGDPGARDPRRRQELPERAWEALRREAGFTPRGGWWARSP